MLTIRRELKIVNGTRGRKRITRRESAREVEPGRVPRISRLMALAIRFEGLLVDGTVADQSELARLTHITQPRMTQIMNLLHLAPAIQEALLFMPKLIEGKDPITEKSLRAIVAEVSWAKQLVMWRAAEKGRVDLDTSHYEVAVIDCTSPHTSQNRICLE